MLTQSTENAVRWVGIFFVLVLSVQSAPSSAADALQVLKVSSDRLGAVPSEPQPDATASGVDLYGTKDTRFETGRVARQLLEAAGLYRGERGGTINDGLLPTTIGVGPFSIVADSSSTMDPVFSTSGGRSWFLPFAVFVVVQLGLIAVLMLAYLRSRKSELFLVESEARFRDFAAISSDWYWETDADLRFSHLSDKFESMTGMPKHKILGKTREEIPFPDIDPDLWDQHLETIREHRPFRDFVYSRMVDGETRWLSISGQPVFRKDGNFVGYRGIGRDITMQYGVEEALSKALRDAEAANQAKTEFLATMSHEFRTPLNAILGFSEVLRDQFFGPLGTEKYKDYAAGIHGSGQHMLELINDILDIAAIEVGKRPISMEEVDLNEVLSECTSNVISKASEANVALVIDIEENIPALYADRRSVVQIVLNLLSNAVKFTQPNGTVRISASRRDSDHVLEVSDNGIGIGVDEMETITEPFSQACKEAHVAMEGTGLGLSIVKSLVDAHNGTLEIASTLGKGTSVSVVLPQTH